MSEERIAQLEERIKKLEDFIAEMNPEANLRASMAQAFREMADDLEDEELTPAKRFDPADNDDE